MCGIAGLIGLDDRARAVSAVGAMVSELARRGPDGEGIEVWNKAVLGHRRLSIFDLSEAGRQPMLSPDRSIGVVFNGAIYNFLELRADLQSGGYEFRSHTDTEVLSTATASGESMHSSQSSEACSRSGYGMRESGSYSSCVIDSE